MVSRVWEAADYDSWPAEFKPNLSPEQVIRAGSFGGAYFADRSLISVEEFPPSWFDNVDESLYLSDPPDPGLNKYGVAAGTSQAEWEANGWMDPGDPRGWFQWYCRYWLGRRVKDDRRQIDRWVKFASVDRGRWTRTLYKKIAAAEADVHDDAVSPVIRQSLLHWAYAANVRDFDRWARG